MSSGVGRLLTGSGSKILDPANLWGGNTPKAQDTGGIPAWAAPYYQDYLSRASDLSKQPYQPYQGQTLAGMNPYQQQGLEGIAQQANSGAISKAAGQELTNTLTGGYLDSGNPYMNALVDKSQGDVIRGYQQSVIPQLDMIAARSGSFGNSGMDQQALNAQRQLVSQLGDISTQIRGGSYENERNRMQSALGMAPQINQLGYADANALLGAGSFQQQQQQAVLDDARARFQDQRNGSQNQLNILGSALGNNSYGQSTQSQGMSPMQGALGGAMAGSSFGPWGALIGGGAGAIMGSRSQNK